MNDNELKKLWQQQPLRDPALSPAEVISAMQNKTSQLRGILNARDLRELCACAFVAIIFGIFYFTVYRTPTSRLGCLIIIGGAIFIAWKIVYTRRKTPPAPPGATIVESLRAELNAVRAQVRLLGSVLWWYLLPLTIGELVATWGLRIDLSAKILSALVFIAINAFIYWLNQRAVSLQLLPLQRQLESLLRSAETGEPLDQAHVANLRPIVLSMAAAEHVKPAEFKVAFWQMALWGEIGFIGIWFFLMLGRAMDADDWKTNESTLAMPTNVSHIGETNRYSVVARTVIDLFNAGDYAAVQALFNQNMSNALPPREASEFFGRLATRVGSIQEFAGPTTNGYQGWTAFRLRCQRGELTMSLALDANDQISGIHFRPATKPKPARNIAGIVRRIFTPLHLAWLVLFFLGGLLYSWLLQKTTHRAVGISTLGVHLHKGTNLLLWDEIKEVRIFRLLNIRSLWLISETGEKTIMPWTSLERHRDLKAAVDGFAPANHPIRKNLPLLDCTGRIS